MSAYADSGPGVHARGPGLEQYEYVDTAYGGVNKRNIVRKLGDVRLNGLSDCYASHNRATDALPTWVQTHTNKDGNPTVAGFDGPTWADNLHIDLDAEGDLKRALTYLHQVLDRLESWGVDLGAVRIYFSGAKGFHLEIPHTLLGGFTPSRELHKRLRRAAKHILGAIPFDTSVYDKIRLWRLENSRNAKSGLYKIRLTVADARTADIDAITTLAKQPRDTTAVPELTAIPDDEWLPVDELVAIWDATIVDDDRDSDTANEQHDPTDEARDRQTSAAIAASWPHGGDNKVEGETGNAKASRHADYLMPIVGLLSRREASVDRICRIVEAGAEQADDRTFLIGRDWRDEIKRIADGADARIKNDEEVKGLPSLAKAFPGLAAVLDALWPVPRLNIDDVGWFLPPSTNGHAPTPGDGGTPPARPASATPRSRKCTETGNAERLVDQYGDRLRFCHPWKQWLCWDGKRWKPDTMATVRAWAKVVMRSIYAEAARATDPDVRKGIAEWAKKSETAAARAAMVKLSESEIGIPIAPEQMDVDGFLLNVLNGTVDLRTGQLRPPAQRDNITKLAPVAFDPEATCLTFLAFLERVLPDPDVRRFMQRYIGYCLTADISEQCLAFLYGGGSNGKSTLLTLIRTLLGDYAKHAAPDVLTERKGDRHSTELADLFGARLVTSVEIDEGKRLAEVLVKQMTGGDPMKARLLFRDFFEWMPTHKLLLAANHKPEIKGTDHAIWRRIHLVPFTVTISDAEKDKQLPAKLMAEGPGILNWAISGCLDWQRNGLGVPQAVKDATNEYRAEQDILADFLADHTVIDPQAYAVSGVLYRAYTAWADGNGSERLSSQAFGRGLTERGFKADTPWIGGKRTRVWRGLGLG